MANPDLEIARDMARLWDNPLGHVLYVYRWGLDDLRAFLGPDVWQIDWLDYWGDEIRNRGFDGTKSVLPIRITTRAGHGVGKSAIVSWACNFIMDTRPHCKGIVTANSSNQLETKTWPEIVKWRNRSITRSWFKVTASRGSLRMAHHQHPTTWRCDAIPWRKEQPEAFAGQHAVDSTSFYINDEASAIDRAIFEVQDGGLTDGEPMQFLFGNPTRNNGYFYDTHMNSKIKRLYRSFKVDSRDAMIPNKEKLAQDIETYGFDSDYIRVKIRGEFPAQSTDQFISTPLVENARRRESRSIPTDPLIWGVDVARKGGDETTIYKRRGKDARTWPPLHLLPSAGRKDWLMHVAGMIAEMAEKERPDVIFVDGGGVGGGLIDRLNQLQVPGVVEVLFGGKSPSARYRNRGSYMYGVMRDWLEDGGAIPNDDLLQAQLTMREYFYDPVTSAIMLESKDQMIAREGVAGGLSASPDRADGLALTFAYPVGPREADKTTRELQGRHGSRTNDADYVPEM